MVQTMLVVDCILACTQFSDGMFPEHVSTKVAHACGYMGLNILSKSWVHVRVESTSNMVCIMHVYHLSVSMYNEITFPC